jgi:hypothetical protein
MGKARTGRPLFFLLICVISWITARIYIVDTNKNDALHIDPAAFFQRQANAMPRRYSSKVGIERKEQYLWEHANVAKRQEKVKAANLVRNKGSQHYNYLANSSVNPAHQRPFNTIAQPIATISYATGYSAIATRKDATRLDESALILAAQTPAASASAAAVYDRRNLKRSYEGKHATLYAYGFWRKSDLVNANSALYTAVGPASYGASQYGIIATIPVSKAGLDINLRTSGSPISNNEIELAAGIRWQPAKKFPVLLIAERRFRPYSLDHFAAIAVLNPGALKLGRKVEASFYGQAGSIFGKEVSGFFDANANVSKHWSAGTKARLGIGAGGWAGGQKSGYRVDTGPILWGETTIGKMQLRLQADWRYRIAGNAKPDDGPSITISTGF